MDSNNCFGFGVFIGALGMFIITLSCLINSDPPEIRSKTKLQPEIVLTTDGKTVDTLYVYKGK